MEFMLALHCVAPVAGVLAPPPLSLQGARASRRHAGAPVHDERPADSRGQRRRRPVGMRRRWHHGVMNTRQAPDSSEISTSRQAGQSVRRARQEERE